MTGKKRILHADDVERWRDLVQDTLTPEYDIISVQDCDEVLPKLSQGDIDLVVLDLLMPGSGEVDTGYEVLQQIRKNFPATPVVMYTGAGFASPLNTSDFEKQWNVPVVFKHEDGGAARLREQVGELLAE